MNYSKILKEIELEVKQFKNKGLVASYIPELAKIDFSKFGMHLRCIGGESFSFGDYNEKFSIQSIAKVMSLAQVISLIGKDVWKRMDVEPSGTSFNSLVQLEYEKGIPRNPLINAGAIVIADILVGLLPNPKMDFLNFVRKIADDSSIEYNLVVAQSEKETGYRNIAHANLLKAYGNLLNPVDKVLDLYFHICSVEMSCEQLSKSFLLFANQGVLPHSGERVLTISQTKRINAIMQTCGFYDEAGEFSFKVGLPGKSGVGGGIVAVYPNVYTVAVWSPPLNRKGNSVWGMKALELLTTKTGASIF